MKSKDSKETALPKSEETQTQSQISDKEATLMKEIEKMFENPNPPKENCAIEKIIDTINVVENTEIRKQIKLTNNGIVNWSKFFTFVCLNNSDKNSYLKGNDVSLKVAIKAGSSINVEVIIPAKKVLKGKYTSVWQLRNDNNDYIGEQITLNINVEKEFFRQMAHTQVETKIEAETKIEDKKKVVIVEPILKDLEFKYGHQLKIMKTTYLLEGIPDIKILVALNESQGKIEEALCFLF